MSETRSRALPTQESVPRPVAKAGVVVIGAPALRRCVAPRRLRKRLSKKRERDASAPTEADTARPHRAGGGVALWAVKSLLSTAFSLAARAPTPINVLC